MNVNITGDYYNQVVRITDLPNNKYGITLYIGTDGTNCKLSYIHGAGSLAYVAKDLRKNVIDELLRKCKGCVILNTTEREIFNFIKATYPTYYAQEVPIGYYNGFQFHVCFKNTIVENRNCRIPNEMVNVPAGEVPPKKVLRDKLIALLKSKRRKNDYVDEFINSL